MKKNLLLLSVLVALIYPATSHSQLINQGFETWTNDLAVPSAMNPNSGNATTGWIDYNFFNYSLVGSSPISVFRCDTAHSGNYSARIETVIYTPTSYNIYKAWGIPFIGHNYLDTLGILFDGNLNETTTTYKPGIPCTQKLSSFSFYYKYAPQSGDTAECRVLLVKQRNAVGGGLVKITSATSSWTQATIPFVYVDTVQPDTLYILFSSSSLDRKPKAGSIFWIDDASVTILSDVNNIQMMNEMNIYPNPTSGIFKLQMNSGQTQVADYQLSVFNMLGENIYSTKMNSDKTEIDLSKEPQGIYSVQIRTDKGLATKKIILNR
ncbi:MAG TPA: T9SS type A sorting domain-containing protein [Bacteroidia bacterium]